MEMLLHLGPNTAAHLVSALISATWEGAILAAAAWTCLRLLPGLGAAARSAVWMNVFLLAVLLHGLPALGFHGPSAIAARHAAFQLSLNWSLGVAAVWAMLSLLRGVQLVVGAVRARGMAHRAIPVELNEELRALLCATSAAGRVARIAELCTSSEVERPSVFGFSRPRVLMPEALMERLTPAELRQVVMHEMEHLRRGDDWTNLLQKLALVVFPLNPVLLWVERRLCTERELACDDGVLRSNAGRKAYAICLTRLAEYSMLRRSFSLVLGAWERQSELVRRVHRILRTPKKGMGPRQTVVLTASLMVGVLGCALGLSRSPELVSFEAPAMQAQGQLPSGAGLAPVADFAATTNAERSAGTHAQLVNAVMPQTGVTARAGAEPSSAVKPVALRKVRRKQPAATQQAWVLMTAWNEMDSAPSLVLAVAQVDAPSDPRPTVNQDSLHSQQKSKRSIDGRMIVDPAKAHGPTYAAVPFGNGWLLIQI